MPQTIDENDFLVQQFIGLTLPQIRTELRELEIPVSGTKSVIEDRVRDLLDNGELAQNQLIHAIDKYVPWSRQHVFLLNGPARIPLAFSSVKALQRHLKRHRLLRHLNKHLPLLLPETLSLSSIEFENSRLRILAVKRRDYTIREPDLDEEGETVDGDPLELRAFVHHISRGMTIFEWNLVSNVAMLEITELPSGETYEEVREEFEDLTSGWCDLSRFDVVPIHRAIAKLHRLEEEGRPEARSHGIEYRTLQGRRLSGHSSTKSESVLGEAVIDEALHNIRSEGVGRTGNLYWLPAAENPSHENPLDRECHVVLIGHRNRVSFRANNSSAVVRHVLSRIRAHC